MAQGIFINKLEALIRSNHSSPFPTNAYRTIDSSINEIWKAPELEVREFFNYLANLQIDSLGDSEQVIANSIHALLETTRLGAENRSAQAIAFYKEINRQTELHVSEQKFDEQQVAFLIWCFNEAAWDLPAQLIEHNKKKMFNFRRDNVSVLNASSTHLFEAMTKQIEGDDAEVSAFMLKQLSSFENDPDILTDMFAQVISNADTRSSEIAMFWLLDPSRHIRLGAALGLGTLAQTGTLSPTVTNLLALIRSWMPKDEAQLKVAEIIRQTMKSQQTGTQNSKRKNLPSKITASMVDGVGAQSFYFYSAPYMYTFLTKIGFGLTDALKIPMQSAVEREMFESQFDTLGSFAIPADAALNLIRNSVAEGIERNSPPVVRLLECAKDLDLSGLQPHRNSLETMLNSLYPNTDHGTNKSSKINITAKIRSQDIEHLPIESWFEDSPEITSAIEKDIQASESGEPDTALDAYLQTRYRFWSEVFLRCAIVLKEARKPWQFTADNAAGCLKKLPAHDLPLVDIIANNCLDFHDDQQSGAIPVGSSANGSSWAPDAYEKGLLAACIMTKPLPQPQKVLELLTPALVEDLSGGNLEADPASVFETFLSAMDLVAAVIETDDLGALFPTKERDNVLEWRHGFLDATKMRGIFPKSKRLKLDKVFFHLLSQLVGDNIPTELALRAIGERLSFHASRQYEDLADQV